MYIVSTPAHYNVFESFDAASRKYVDEIQFWPLHKVSLLTFFVDEWERTWYEIRFFHPESTCRDRYAKV